MAQTAAPMATEPVSPLPTCYSEDLLPPGEALARLESAVEPLPGHEPVPLARTLGRVLAVDVVSPVDVPGHTNSAVDGYAVAGAGLPASGARGYELIGTARAGRAFGAAVGEGQTVQVLTGGVMPEGTDTVVMQEQVRAAGPTIEIGTGHRAGQNVRQAGEDLAAGDLALAAGKRLMPAELGLLASLGVAEVRVTEPVRVATFSTGDELRSPGEAREPGAVYDANRYILGGMLARLGVEVTDLGVVPDDAAATRAALEQAAGDAHVVVTSGGASTGEADHVTAALESMGQVGFWRIAIRPGRPLAFGRLGEALFFGLPGNPVAVMVTFYQFVQPALRRLMGEPWSAPVPEVEAVCATSLRKKPGRVEYYRAVLERDPSLGLVVRHTGKTGSGLLHTMCDANCLIVLPEDSADVEAGERVEVQPFFGLV